MRIFIFVSIIAIAFTTSSLKKNKHLGFCQSNARHLHPQSAQKIKNTHSTFTDSDFPKQKALKGLQKKGYGWKRLSSIMGNSIRLFGSKGIHIDDIVQGSLGDCYLLTAIGALAQHPEVIKDLFVEQQVNYYGIYGVNWIVGGVPYTIIVDDYVPTLNGQPAFLQLHGDPQIWPQILQKSYAKIYGSYLNIQGGQPRDVMHQLTGAPAWIYQHSKQTNKKQFFDRLKNFEDQGFLFGTFTWQSPCADNLVDGHAYTMVGVKKNVRGSDGKTYNLVKIRNPWGQERWRGKWSDSSQLWNSQNRREVGHQNSNDGNFYISIEDYLKCFYWTSVLAFKQNNIRDYIRVPLSQNTFQFEISTSEPFFVQYDTLDGRIIPKECKDKIYQIQVKIYKGNSLVIQNEAYWSSYGYAQLKSGSGKYKVQVSIQYSKSNVQKPQHAVFSVYSDSEVKIQGSKKKYDNSSGQVTFLQQQFDQAQYWGEQKKDYNDKYYDDQYDENGNGGGYDNWNQGQDWNNNWFDEWYQDDWWEFDFWGSGSQMCYMVMMTMMFLI